MTDHTKALRDAADWLDEAADEIAGWGVYASEYFQTKHRLSAAIELYRERAATIRAAAEPSNVGALRDALQTIADFAPGNGDVCEIIAKRARAALAFCERCGKRNAPRGNRGQS